MKRKEVSDTLGAIGSNLVMSCRFILASRVYVACLAVFTFLLIAWPLGAPERIVWLGMHFVWWTWITETIRLTARSRTWAKGVKPVSFRITPLRIVMFLLALGAIALSFLVLLAALGVGSD